MSRRAMAGARSIICETFSSSVIRESRSLTRSSTGRRGFLYFGSDGLVCAASDRLKIAEKMTDARAFANFIYTPPDLETDSARRTAENRNLCAGQSLGLRFELDWSRTARKGANNDQA